MHCSTTKLLFIQVIAVLALLCPAGVAQTFSCQGRQYCYDTNSTVATVTSFRISNGDRQKVASVTVRFENKTNRPLILGYVKNSGIATDERGNRYVVYGTNAVRGIGEIVNNRFDPKFTIPAGQGADARFELIWRHSSRDLYGHVFALDLAVREIDRVDAAQFRMGAEHALHFDGLTNGLQGGVGATPGPATSGTTSTAGSRTMVSNTATSADTASAATVPVADPCVGKQRCYFAGPYYAEVAQITSARVGTYKDHVLRVNLKIHNLTQEPLILAYVASSSLMTDNLGNRYFWGRVNTVDTSATGIGTSTKRSANSSFVLNPGKSRNATFQLIRYRPGNTPLGTEFSWDIALAELEVLSPEHVATKREYAMSFTDIHVNSYGSASAESPGEAVRQLKDLFGGKKKK